MVGRQGFEHRHDDPKSHIHREIPEGGGVAGCGFGEAKSAKSSPAIERSDHQIGRVASFVAGDSPLLALLEQAGQELDAEALRALGLALRLLCRPREVAS